MQLLLWPLHQKLYVKKYFFHIICLIVPDSSLQCSLLGKDHVGEKILYQSTPLLHAV